MALKPARSANPVYADASYFVDEVAERGGIVVQLTQGSGEAFDSSDQVATYAASPSGKMPVGVLMWDVVDVDLTRYKLNQHKCELQKGQKAPITREGFVHTNMTEGTISVGPAYLGHSGRIRSTIDNNIVNSPFVGFVETKPDEDGYVKLVYNLPTRSFN